MAAQASHPRIAIVDDDPADVALMRDLLGELPVVIDDYAHAEDLLGAMRRRRPPHYRTVIVDLRLPRMDGYRLIRRYREIIAGASVVVVSGVPDEHEARVESLRAGACAYVPKRLMVERLEPIVRQVLDIP